MITALAVDKSIIINNNIVNFVLDRTLSSLFKILDQDADLMILKLNPQKFTNLADMSGIVTVNIISKYNISKDFTNDEAWGL